MELCVFGIKLFYALYFISLKRHSSCLLRAYGNASIKLFLYVCRANSLWANNACETTLF